MSLSSKIRFQNLSEEVLLHVYQHLNFYAKLNLAKTCRKFRNSLYHTALFEDISIPRHHTNELVMRFKRGELNGSKVKICCLHHSELEKPLLLELPRIFPNLKKLTFPDSGNHSKIKSGDCDVVYGLRSTLEVCCQYLSKCIFDLLPRYRFICLKQISLNAYATLYEDYTPNFIHFKNAPCLENMVLYGYTVGLDLLEKLHLYTPNLKRLALISSVLKFRVIRNPENIKPVSKFTSFQIFTEQNFNEHNNHLVHYLLLKYPNLRILHFYSHYHLHTSQLDPPFFHMFKQLMGRLDDLKTNFYLKEGQPSAAITSLTGRSIHMIFPGSSNILENKKYLYNIYLNTILTKLSLPIISASNIYHKNLIVPNIRCLRLFDAEFPFREENEHRTDGRNIIELDKLLFTYRGLETLDVNCDYVDIIAENLDHYTPYPSLRSIKFCVLSISEEGIFAFIRDYVPHLCELDLSTMEENLLFRLVLPKHTFHSLTLDIFRPDELDEKWKYNYEIRTENMAVKKFTYLHKGKMDIKVSEKRLNFGYSKAGQIEIVCKRLLGLKHNSCVLF